MPHTRHTAVKRGSHTRGFVFLAAHVDQDLCFSSAGPACWVLSRCTATLGVVVLVDPWPLAAAAMATAMPMGGCHATLAVLETTDLHFNVRSHDYFKLAGQDLWFERTVTLEARRARILQHPVGGQRRHHPGHRAGRLRGHHQPYPRTQQLSMYKAMGAWVLTRARWATTSSTTACPSGTRCWAVGWTWTVHPTKKCAGAGLPRRAGQRVQQQDQEAAGAAPHLLERTLVAKGTDGKEVKLPIKIGVIGFTTPAS